MTPHAYDVCAIGNALVDVIANASDEFLHEHKIAKGSMTLIDAEQAANEPNSASSNTRRKKTGMPNLLLNSEAAE